MEKALQRVHQQMDTLKADLGVERDRLQRDNVGLNNLVTELRLRGRTEFDSFKQEVERMTEGMREELLSAEDGRASAIRERDSLERVSC